MTPSSPIAGSDILQTVEFWAFRSALLIVFVSWLVRHVIHELKTLIAAVIAAWREIRQL